MRPEFQNPEADAAPKDQHAKKQGKLDIKVDAPKQTKAKGKTAKVKVKKQPWPKTLPERITAVRSALVEHGKPASAPDIAKLFTRANKETVEELLETLTAVGQARVTDDGRYAS